MSTSVPKLFRLLSIEEMHRYFAFRKVNAEIVDWKVGYTDVVKSVISLINTLPDAERTVVFTDAEAIAELADDAGHLAMLDATQSKAAVLDAFDRIDAAEGRALWLYINDPEAFRRATWVRHSDQLRKGRSWDGFLEPAGGRLDLSADRLSALANACADAYRQRDGFRGAAEIEQFERLQSWRDDEEEGSVTQITIYTEDRPQCLMAFEDSGLMRQHCRPASELHIIYSAADRSIDVVAKGGRSMRKAIAVLFARHLLGVEASLDSIEMRDVDLSVLADRSTLARNIGGSIAEVDVKSVRFQPFDETFPSIVYFRRRASIYEHFEHNRLDMRGYEIDRVELTFTFLPDTGRPRGKRVTVTLTSPNGCSVKDQGQLYRPAIEEFLERAGIYRTIGEEDDEHIDAAD